MDKLRGNIEDLIPGTERETAKAQLSGAGKYEKAIDSFVSTGRGGGRKRKPEEVSGTNQRMRLGKGTTKTKEGPVQRPVTSTGDIKAPKTGDPGSLKSFMKKLGDAEREQADASVVRFPNGKPVPRKNQYYLQNNPDAAQQHAARQAAQAVDNAQKSIADIRTKAAQAREKVKPEPIKPQQPEAPKPEPQRTEPVDTKPTLQPQVKREPASAPKPEEKKKKKPVETPNTQLPQE